MNERFEGRKFQEIFQIWWVFLIAVDDEALPLFVLNFPDTSKLKWACFWKCYLMKLDFPTIQNNLEQEVFKLRPLFLEGLYCDILIIF